MADEITLTVGTIASKGSLSVQLAPRTFQTDLSGTKFIRNVQAVGTTHEALVVGDLASAGVYSITNLDTTNFAELGVDVAGTFYPVDKILPGETIQSRLSSLSRHVQADTAAVNLDILIFEA